MKKILILALSVFILAVLFVSEGFGFDAAFDLRTLGYAPAVENQGSDQTCWTFSTMAALESNYLRRTSGGSGSYFDKFLGNNSNLSELHLAWFSFKNPEEKKDFAYVRNGSVIQPSDSLILNHAGNPQMALAFLSRHDGPVRESALPYNSAFPAAGTSPRAYPRALRVVGANYVESLNVSLSDEDENDVFVPEEEILKLYLITNGAISAGVYWDTTYMSSTYAYYNPISRKGGHAITIIGWDDNYSRDNFSPSKPDKNGAWLVQNSWGTSWGNNGYFWMSYEQLLRYAMVFEVEPVNSRVREYYHDDLGFTHEVPLYNNTDNNTAIVANVFKVKGDHEKLREIGFYSTSNAYNAVFFVYDIGTENSLEKLSSAADNIENLQAFDSFEGLGDKGYVVNLLREPVELTKDHYFAIMMRILPSDFSPADFKPTIAAEVKIPNYRTANAEINAQETYFSMDNGDTWQDAKYHTFQVGANEITGFNACIKGFTYVPDERVADDWTIVSSDGKAQLSISLLKEAEPREIIVKGSGIDNILHKVERENASTGDAQGTFYTLKLICDLKSDNAKLTSLKINGEEVLTGSIRNIKYKNDMLNETRYIDIAKTGVSFNDMTKGSGVIESTEGYTKNSDNSSGGDGSNSGNDSNGGNNSGNNNTTTRTTGGGSGGGGCNSVFSVLGLAGFSVLVIKRKK